MKLNRREFVGLAGSAAALAAIPHASYGAGFPDAETAIEKNGWRLTVSPTGDILSLKSGGTELINRKLTDAHPRVLFPRGENFTCNQPVSFRREGSTVFYLYAFSGRYSLKVDYEINLLGLEEGSVAVQQKIGLEASSPVNGDIKLVLSRNLQLPYENRQVFLPLKNGVGRRRAIGALENEDEYAYKFAGTYDGGKPQSLAVPMVDEFSSHGDLRLTFCTDPYFTSHFVLPFGEKPGRFHCIYPKALGLRGREERTVCTAVHRGDPRSAMKAFYECALSDVEEGPDWLHDVAMISYDYLSEDGAGWSRDIDKLTELIKPAERGKVFMAIHGWYDMIGRYAYDHRTKSLDKKWTAFQRGWSEGGPSIRPVEMSIEDMHRRIRYARDKGFRVGLYYADNVASCTGAAGEPDPAKVLMWEGWEGPDTAGKSFQQNPLHPEVREFFKDYAQALMTEYGKELDGMIMDETYYIDPGNPGTELCPGYADRAMMTLMKEVADLVFRNNPQCPFLASDCIGFWHWENKAPYALVAHSTYQDTHCRPESWPFGLFPNFRNTLWSCNWSPVSNFYRTEYGVETFDAPVVYTNGPVGDDTGIAEMDPQMLKKFMDLYDQRKQRRMEISWIEEKDGNPTYLGRPIKYKQSL